jgi:hypothetical protein
VKPHLQPVPAEGSEPEAEPPASGLRPTFRFPAILPWALFAVALAAAVVFGLLWQRAQSTEHRAAEVKFSATRFLGALTNFKGDTIDADVADIQSFAVGDFANQVRTFFNQGTMDALRRAKAVSIGKIRSVFVESVQGVTASVFGVVDESVSNSAVASSRAEIVRIHIDMIDTGGGWKVSRVDILQSPAQGPLGATP